MWVVNNWKKQTKNIVLQEETFVHRFDAHFPDRYYSPNEI